MEDKINNINYNKNSNYSNIIKSESDDSKMLKINQLKNTSTSESSLNNLKKNKKEENIENDINKLSTNNNLLTNNMMFESNDGKNFFLKKQKENHNSKVIKSIGIDDLIPTTINGRSILRINPFIYQNQSYEFLSDNIYILLKDQLGSKFLQEKLDSDTEKALSYLYPALLPHILILIKDSFANYFIQKVLYYLNDDQIEYILTIINPEFFGICCDKYGCRVIQSLMNFLQTKKIRQLFYQIIEPNIIPLINELNGIHIIYKFINNFPEFLNEVNNIIYNNCISLATHQRGCFFIQNYLLMINKRIDCKQKIVNIILNNCLILIIDQFGNYLIQCLLSLGDNEIILAIINKILNNIAFYSKHKYSNYVIEKLLFYAKPEHKNIIINKLSSPEIMTELILDQQGNFIILKALMYSNNEKKNIMLNTIDNLKPQIKTIPHGNIFLKKLNNIKYSLLRNNNNYFINKKH
jgi:hypothetical protein